MLLETSTDTHRSDHLIVAHSSTTSGYIFTEDFNGKTKTILQSLQEKFADLFPKWKDFRPLKGRIEDVSKKVYMSKI